jgi:uncharacterized protein (TIGR03086 family)
MVMCDIDLRVGGDWRYVTRDTDGLELAWHGTYQEVDAPRRLVSTEVFEPHPHAEATNTLVLDEVDGATTLTVTVRHRTKANRDGVVASGMERGLQVSLDVIEDLLPSLADSTTVANRFRNVAGRFTEVVGAVPPEAWDQPAPCEGWVARDVVRHLVEWVPPFLTEGAGVELRPGPSVDTDPAGAWRALDDAIQGLLDDPVTATRTFAHPQAGTHPLDQAIGMFILGDVLIHTWDVARATGLDESIDAAEAAGMYAGMLPLDEVLRASGHYGARVDVPDDADIQTKLIAFTGRRP